VAAQSVLLKSRTVTIVAANSVSKFGGILFTPIRLFTVVCYAAGPVKVRLSYRRQVVPPPPPKPLHIRPYIRLRLVNAHFSTMTNTFLTPRALIIARSGVPRGLKYEHWLMKQKFFRDQNGCQWRTVPHMCSEKCSAQNSEIPTNIDIYGYSRTQKVSLVVLG